MLPKNGRFVSTPDSLGVTLVPRVLPGVAAGGDSEEMEGGLRRVPAQMRAGLTGG